MQPPKDKYRCDLCGKIPDARLYPVQQKYHTLYGKKGKIWWLCEFCYRHKMREDYFIPQHIGIHPRRLGEVSEELAGTKEED